MEQINTKVKKWGNSFGIILPKNIVDTENIKDGSEITITVQTTQKSKVSDLFALGVNLPKIKKNTKEIMREIDEELWPERF